jgi:hypothetical protein
MIIIILFLLSIPKTAYAYIDPGQGSYVVEIIIALLLGGLFAIKVWWNRVKEFLFRRKDGKNKK